MSSQLKSIKSFFDYLLSSKYLRKDAEYEIKSRLYSPIKDESTFEELLKYLSIVKKPRIELLKEINEIAMRLQLHYVKKEDFSKVAHLSHRMTNTLSNSLRRVRKAKLIVSEKEASQLRILARYWRRSWTVSKKIFQVREDEMLTNAESYILEGKYGEAIELLNEVLEATKKTKNKTEIAKIIHSIAKALNMKGDHNEALVYLKAAAKIDPKLWYEVGKLLFSVKRIEDSVIAYQRYLEHKPDDPKALNNLGYGLLILGDFDESKKAFENALEIAPNHPNALLNLAVLHSDCLHEYNVASDYAKRALELAPDDINITANLAEIKVLSGHYDEARDYANKILGLDADPFYKIAMHFAISTSYFLEGQVEKGDEHLDLLKTYKQTLPQSFVNMWSYEGILNMINESNIQVEYKQKLLQTVNNLPSIWYKTESAIDEKSIEKLE